MEKGGGVARALGGVVAVTSASVPIRHLNAFAPSSPLTRSERLGVTPPKTVREDVLARSRNVNRPRAPPVSRAVFAAELFTQTHEIPRRMTRAEAT